MAPSIIAGQLTIARRSLFSASPSSLVASSRLASLARQTPARTTRTFTSTMAPQNSDAFFEAVKARRTYYQLTDKSPIPDARIVQIVKDAVTSTPTSFNGQQARAVVLFKKDHLEFWDMVWDVLQPHLPDAEGKAKSRARIDMFRNAYATVLFLDDNAAIKAMQERVALYADRFPGWAAHSNGMLQYVLWTAFEAEGLGANLQHYNPLVDDKAKARWGIPQDWTLHAMMPIGERAEPAKGWTEGKAVQDVDERVKVHGL